MSDMNPQEQNLIDWLADMNEDDAFALAKKAVSRAHSVFVGRTQGREHAACQTSCW